MNLENIMLSERSQFKKRHIYSTQCSVMAHVGKKKSKKRVHICICIIDTLCCTPETNIVNQLYSNKKFKKDTYCMFIFA